MNIGKQFGKLPSKQDKLKYAASSNWDGEKFVNLTATKIDVNIHTLPKMLYKMIFEKAGREPKNKIPIQKFEKSSFISSTDEIKFIWYGHSVLLFNIKGTIVMIDPMMGFDASPTAPFATERFSDNTLNILDELPQIDYLLISHDHYDHLDYDSIIKLDSKVNYYLVALGVSRHLESWGVGVGKITEFDWWQSTEVEGLKITFTPSRHFSGRAIIDRAKSLWGGWVIESSTKKIYFSGDGGYGRHFEEVGKRLGPFDIGFMECGQYNENWHDIHMYPEESVQATIDSKVRKVVPVHWGAFALSQHSWKEPVDLFYEKSINKGVVCGFPKLGVCYSIVETSDKKWWDEIEYKNCN